MGPLKWFWTSSNHYGRVQIVLVRIKLDFYGLFFIIWTCPKQLRSNQNELDPSKTIGTRPKSFGIQRRTRLRVAKIFFFAIFKLKIVLQINYWKTKYKPQAEHSIKCPLFSAVKCNITEKIGDNFHKFSNTGDQNRNMSQFSFNFTGAKHCKVFC